MKRKPKRKPRKKPGTKSKGNTRPYAEQLKDAEDGDIITRSNGEVVEVGELPIKCQAFLCALLAEEEDGGEWTLSGAARASGININSHYYWLKTVPGYEETYEMVKLELKARWHGHWAKRVKTGLKETLYVPDGKGNMVLKHERYREDGNLMKAHMQYIDPENFAKKEDTGAKVVIQITQSQEWTDHKPAPGELEAVEAIKAAAYGIPAEIASIEEEPEIVEAEVLQIEEVKEEKPAITGESAAVAYWGEVEEEPYDVQLGQSRAHE